MNKKQLSLTVHYNKRNGQGLVYLPKKKIGLNLKKVKVSWA